MLETHTYVRKQFDIEATQVTEANMAEVAGWTNGTIKMDSTNRYYVEIDVQNPTNPRQGQAYAGDWVLYAGRGFKVYNNKAFRNSFEQTSVGGTYHEVEARPYIAPAPIGTNLTPSPADLAKQTSASGN